MEHNGLVRSVFNSDQTESQTDLAKIAKSFDFTQLKLPQIQKIMMEFERQSEIMDMKEEMMNDAIDDAMGDEDDEEERCNYRFKIILRLKCLSVAVKSCFLFFFIVMLWFPKC